MCPDGRVYNLEVNGTHTYLIERSKDWSKLQREREGYALSVIVAMRRAITPQGRVDLTRLVPGSLAFDPAIAEVEAAALDNFVATKQGEQK